MSNPFKSVAKVFKKVIKSTVGKIVIGALMIGAIVLTAGAAIPALGAALGMSGGIAATLGLSGTLGSIVAGAVSMGAVGAVVGGLGGLASGKGFFKGATGGFLMGAATGGLLGGIGVLGPGGLFGGAGAAAAGSSTAAAGLPGNMITGSLPDVAGQFMANTAITGSVGGAVGGGAASGGSLFGGLLGSGGIGPVLQAGGAIVSGFAGGAAKQKEMEFEAEQLRAKYDRTAYNYGYKNIYGDDKNVPESQEQWYQYAPTNFAHPVVPPAEGLLNTTPSPLINPTAPPVQYAIVNGQVVPVGVPPGG
jgi:hypothetical protein